METYATRSERFETALATDARVGVRARAQAHER